MADPYREQVRLLLEIRPLVMAEPVFALKGGTAINLFEWDLPRQIPPIALYTTL